MAAFFRSEAASELSIDVQMVMGVALVDGIHLGCRSRRGMSTSWSWSDDGESDDDLWKDDSDRRNGNNGLRPED
jgi:hypothetical protein